MNDQIDANKNSSGNNSTGARKKELVKSQEHKLSKENALTDDLKHGDNENVAESDSSVKKIEERLSKCKLKFHNKMVYIFNLIICLKNNKKEL